MKCNVKKIVNQRFVTALEVSAFYNGSRVRDLNVVERSKY